MYPSALSASSACEPRAVTPSTAPRIDPDAPSALLTGVMANQRYELEQLKPYGALDVGAGAGRDCLHLIENGWKVTAQDVGALAALTLWHLSENSGGHLAAHNGPVWTLNGRFGLITSNNVLPHLNADTRDQVLSDCYTKLVPGGIFACNFWGDRHGWVGTPYAKGKAFMSLHEVQDQLRRAGFEEAHVVSKAARVLPSEGPDVLWHEFVVTAVKPATKAQAATAAAERKLT